MTDRLAEYRQFIAARAIAADRHGFAPREINASAKEHQRAVLDFELKPEYAAQAGKNLKDAELMAGNLFGMTS